eukprot:7188045-Alexandrium_andersonii.AAC.1
MHEGCLDPVGPLEVLHRPVAPDGPFEGRLIDVLHQHCALLAGVGVFGDEVVAVVCATEGTDLLLADRAQGPPLLLRPLDGE